MKLVIQRVTQASVEIAGESVGKIGKGYMVLFGAGAGDTKEIADRLFDKMIKLRIFKMKMERQINQLQMWVESCSSYLSLLCMQIAKRGIDQVLWMQENHRRQKNFMNIS